MAGRDRNFGAERSGRACHNGPEVPVAQHCAAERGYAQAPPESEEFYRVLVTSFLHALEAEGQGSQEFSEHLRSFWPGLGDNG